MATDDPFTGLEVDTTAEAKPRPSVDYKNVYTPDTKIKDILDSMGVYDQNVINTQRAREALASKLVEIASDIDLNEHNAEMFQAKLEAINTAKNLLNDLDKAAKDHVTVKLKQKDTETNATAGINIAEFLTKIKMTDNISSGTVVQTKDQIEKALDKQFEERGTVVLDTELEMGGNMLPKEQKEESNK